MKNKEIMEEMVKEAIKEKVAEILGNWKELKNFVGKSIKEILEALVNELMLDKRKIFNQQNGDVGNGFYLRGLQTALGKLNLEVPRTESTTLNPHFFHRPTKEPMRPMTNYLLL
ncbi:MAG: transposase [Candidatus Omnitrophica bacterium]|nr:transposase [Candidatus Omnitrophota bacterium]